MNIVIGVLAAAILYLVVQYARKEWRKNQMISSPGSFSLEELERGVVLKLFDDVQREKILGSVKKMYRHLSFLALVSRPVYCKYFRLQQYEDAEYLIGVWKDVLRSQLLHQPDYVILSLLYHGGIREYIGEEVTKYIISRDRLPDSAREILLEMVKRRNISGRSEFEWKIFKYHQDQYSTLTFENFYSSIDFESKDIAEILLLRDDVTLMTCVRMLDAFLVGTLEFEKADHWGRVKIKEASSDDLWKILKIVDLKRADLTIFNELCDRGQVRVKDAVSLLKGEIRKKNPSNEFLQGVIGWVHANV